MFESNAEQREDEVTARHPKPAGSVSAPIPTMTSGFRFVVRD